MMKSTRNRIPSRLWVSPPDTALREPQGYWNHSVIQSSTTQSYAGTQGLVGIHVPSHDHWTVHLLEHTVQATGGPGGTEVNSSFSEQ